MVHSPILWNTIQLKKRTNIITQHLDDSERQYTKKPVSGYILHNCIYMTFSKGQNCSDEEPLKWLPGLEEGSTTRSFSGVMNSSES